jgi:hypothetical protein
VATNSDPVYVGTYQLVTPPAGVQTSGAVVLTGGVVLQ